jgi:uncharacterized membrane protein YjgN (DUF898 family)
MSAPLFNIIVHGIQAGFDPSKVKAQFSKMFRLEAAQVERVFAATPILLRRNIPEDFANSLVKRLLAIGVAAEKSHVTHFPVLSKAIHHQDRGDVSSDASPMHQSVDFLYGADIRRIPFIFTGSGFSYCKLWLISVLVCMVSVGILYPWARARSLSYLYQHTYFNDINFQCHANSKRIYFLQFLLVTCMALLGVSFLYSSIYFVIALIVFVCAFPYYQFKCNELQYGKFLFCGFGIRPDTTLKDTYITRLVWPVLFFLTAGFLIPYLAFNNHYARLQKKIIDKYEFTFSANPKQYFPLLRSLLIMELLISACVYWRQHFSVYILFAIILGAILCVLIHWRVVLENMRWNNLNSAVGYFKCSWNFSSYGTVVLQNLIFCILTLGLYWPWAKINIAKYKATHLAFFANQRFDKWQKELHKS